MWNKQKEKRHVEEDVLACLTVYGRDLPPLKDVKQVMRISEKKYEVLEKYYGNLPMKRLKMSKKILIVDWKQKK